jgi:hypothetical protein
MNARQECRCGGRWWARRCPLRSDRPPNTNTIGSRRRPLSDARGADLPAGRHVTAGDAAQCEPIGLGVQHFEVSAIDHAADTAEPAHRQGPH